MAMTLDDVLTVYRERVKLHTEAQKGLQGRQRGVLWALLLAVLVVVWRARVAFVGDAAAWTVLAPLAVVVGLIWMYLRLQDKLARVQRVLVHLEGAIERASGRKVQSGRTGEELRGLLGLGEHLFDRDLNVLGADSLFGMLATVRTGLGERGLARYLLEPEPGGDAVERFRESLRRQDAVRELAPRVPLREEIAVMGTSRFQQVPANFFDEWLAAEAPEIPTAYRVGLVVTSLLLLGLLGVGFAHVVGFGELWPNLLVVAGIQTLLAWRLKARVKPILETTVRLSNHVQLVSEGLELLGKESFEAEKLQRLAGAVTAQGDAVKLLKGLQSQIVILQQRESGFFMALSLLIAGGTQAAISIATWKRKNAAAMQGWIAAWAEFEALHALGTYAFEHPENAYPDLLPPTHAPVFEGVGVGHPLLARGACVVNDVELTPAKRFYLISGSNMAGKSTLLRAIGLNAVLAYAGAPVRAESLRISPMRVGASLALIDSLAESKSKFMAEVGRLAAIVRLSETGPVLFLIDELFSGTNSNDRRAAAEAVLRALLRNGAIGALSTHDLALTSLADEESRGLNVHMASPDEGDPLGFDYKLKAGGNRSSNALAILRMMGLEA